MIYILRIINVLIRCLFFASLLLISGCVREITDFKCAHIFEISMDEKQSVNVYIVKQGDSLYKIAKHYGVDVDLLKKTNNMENSYQVNVGSLLYIPIIDNSYDESIITDSRVVRNDNFRSRRNTSSTSIDWEWPCSGLVEEYFSLKNRGIDIYGNIGDPVLAATDGRVVYSGGGVSGLGKLLILSHNEGYITAYAHNSKIFVYNGQEVTKGFKIAEMGDSDSDAPKLHFEIRKNGLPVDPLIYLPEK
ncbi:lipoprotein NlpD [Candidatus Kinetoplastibacterium blastocrithidii TCC012E]|uniref:Lipoprotein NlpD n=1 Tax=Candidatus Kinetoplastidibacterium blastocrithidiae TCC012E TaxID=1208922 RepID=M1LB65_9PROT|nr:peptidoglycan DD-metalloendopeptidase family protein [Candidatus Kinetoplastibacterium blastocrithidii]AFZ83580.1 hypothetical protein CKBE_00391 [Candidatus Kinetoplastibacterium blastocrithidii (ex Strigomonas culicis)]AGF49698.1 lipoprotein NlpD [Candidatus Kinetoplastibacterium blastocrithidii TCC012E]